MIQDILSDEHILITDKEYTWRDAIKFVAAPLYEDGIVTKHYSEAMIKSVEQYGPYIIIGPHLALAHARPEDGANQLGLSLAIFEKPVQFGEEENEQVQVIFCLTAVDSFSHLNIMKSLVNLIRANDKIEQLCTAKDVLAKYHINAKLDHVDISTAASVQPEVIITAQNFQKQFANFDIDTSQTAIIYLQNIVSSQEIEEKLIPVLQDRNLI